MDKEIMTKHMEKVIKLLQELGYELLTDLQQATLKILRGVQQLWENERGK